MIIGIILVVLVASLAVVAKLGVDFRNIKNGKRISISEDEAIEKAESCAAARQGRLTLYPAE